MIDPATIRRRWKNTDRRLAALMAEAAEDLEAVAPGHLSPEEEQAVVQALADGRGLFTPDDEAAVLHWARQTRLASDLLEMVLVGAARLDLRDGEIAILPALAAAEEA